MKFIPTQLKAWQRDPAAFIDITRTPARRKKIGTVAGVRGTPFIHLMYVVERRPPSILG